MSQIQISADVMLREIAIENEWRRNRMLILAQQLANAEAAKEAVAEAKSGDKVEPAS